MHVLIDHPLLWLLFFAYVTLLIVGVNSEPGKPAHSRQMAAAIEKNNDSMATDVRKSGTAD